ncbi:MAG: glycosyltransferase family 4 protein [Pirellulaceae bacterium]|nr:glycosyltransferase family 4 protein [Pirellulaceae bacterium]
MLASACPSSTPGSLETAQDAMPAKTSSRIPPLRMCFVANNLYAVLVPTQQKIIGGAELQQLAIAQCLRDNGHHASIVTNVFDDQRNDEVLQGIDVLKNYAVKDGIPVARFFHPRLTSLWSALRRARADIYYQRCADKMTGIVAAYCKLHGKKFVFSGAHDSDFWRRPPLNLRERLLYRMGIRLADMVIVQSQQQQQLLHQNYGRKGLLLPNVYGPRALSKSEGFVLWVATLRKFKRPLMCLELARKFPQIPFVMIGGTPDDNFQIANEIRQQCPPNLTFLGFQPLEVTDQYFDRASLLLNTSQHEGFPNTFLQAWSRGIPVLTTFDPSSIVASNSFLGRTFSHTTQVGEWILELLQPTPQARKDMQQFCESNYSPQQYVERMLAELQAVPSVTKVDH